MNNAQRYRQWTDNNIADQETCICVQARSSAGYDDPNATRQQNQRQFDDFFRYNLQANCGINAPAAFNSARGYGYEIRMNGQRRCFVTTDGSVYCGDSNHQQGSKFNIRHGQYVNCDEQYAAANQWREDNNLAPL
ncbi:hypothetical protein [Shewanella waksmanii]|uniref:hypothetical protein n=1 Tax=Shewanella waksmanii TaxID=213783 RepID=UPI00373509D7